jgi:hypothetical protein
MDGGGDFANSVIAVAASMRASDPLCSTKSSSSFDGEVANVYLDGCRKSPGLVPSELDASDGIEWIILSDFVVSRRFCCGGEGCVTGDGRSVDPKNGRTVGLSVDDGEPRFKNVKLCTACHDSAVAAAAAAVRDGAMCDWGT